MCGVATYQVRKVVSLLPFTCPARVTYLFKKVNVTWVFLILLTKLLAYQLSWLLTYPRLVLIAVLIALFTDTGNAWLSRSIQWQQESLYSKTDGWMFRILIRFFLRIYTFSCINCSQVPRLGQWVTHQQAHIAMAAMMELLHPSLAHKRTAPAMKRQTASASANRFSSQTWAYASPLSMYYGRVEW